MGMTSYKRPKTLLSGFVSAAFLWSFPTTAARLNGLHISSRPNIYASYHTPGFVKVVPGRRTFRERRIRSQLRCNALPEAAEWEGFPPERYGFFLKEFWQKKPLLIRKAFPPEAMVLGPEEVLALACDDLVTSRLVENVEGQGWDVRYGPFDEQDFADEKDTRRWTVLVNEVDRHVPEVGDLLEAFTFVPNWRVDDIQISYAPKAGGIGPHVDNYDVFLLQGRGRRRWSIENRLVGVEEEGRRLVENSPVRVFESLEEDCAWDLEPGDMLYLPPRVPHNGVSLDGECMTYSIGFRAPSQRDLLMGMATYAQQHLLQDEVFYTDADLTLQKECGEISPQALEKMRVLVAEAVSRALSDDRTLARWVGEALTSPKRQRIDEDYPRPLWAVQGEDDDEEEEDDALLPMCEWGSAAEVLEAIRRGQPVTLYRAEGIKFAYVQDDKQGPQLFIDGSVWRLSPDVAFLAPLITRGPRLSAAELRPLLEGQSAVVKRVETLLTDLLDKGLLYPLRDEPGW